MEAKAVPRSGRRWGAVQMAEAGRTPDAATPRAMLSARLPGPMKPTRNASPFTAAGGGTGWSGGAAIAGDGVGGGSAAAGLGAWVQVAGADVRFLAIQRGLYGKKWEPISSPCGCKSGSPAATLAGFIGHPVRQDSLEIWMEEMPGTFPYPHHKLNRILPNFFLKNEPARRAADYINILPTLTNKYTGYKCTVNKLTWPAIYKQ